MAKHPELKRNPNQLSTTLPNAFPSDTQVNPKGECKAITLRSGRALEDVSNKVNVQPTMEKSKEDATKEANLQQPQQVQKPVKNQQRKRITYPSLNNYGRR
ncbi:hypothetical protein PIB30_046269 [Stylosanthes scabra]|uniref:Reverse transcriptase domain-containing protein n=1 Tax=Stylosanthes scabra TaxID=79078 RepID=A0ABU6YF12_9FABA|nr:hypothetical protein [Stylosanthes scabra]